MAVPRRSMDICPRLDQQTRDVVVVTLEGAEERRILIVVFDVDVVAATEQHAYFIDLTGFGSVVERGLAVSASLDGDVWGVGEDCRDGTWEIEFAGLAVEEEGVRAVGGEGVDGYVTSGEVFGVAGGLGGLIEEEAELVF